MKKYLVLLLSVTFSILTRAQESPITACVFLVSKNNKLNQIFPNSTFPSKLAFTDGDIVEIDPKSNPRFVDENGAELIFDSNTPGIFMNREGEQIKPCNTKARRPQIIEPELTGNKSVTNENTIANLKNKDRKNTFIGKVDVPTNKPKMQIECFSGRDEILYAVNFSVDKKRFDRRLITLIQSHSENAGAGEVLTNAKLLGEKLIELSEQCKGENQPNYCNQPDDGRRFSAKAEALLEELRKIPGFENLDLSLELITGLINIK